MDPRVVSQAQLVAGPRDGEVGEPKPVPVVVDARVAGEQHAALHDRRVDAQPGPGPVQRRVDARRLEGDLTCRERSRRQPQVAVRSGQPPVQRSVDRQRPRRKLAAQPDVRNAQVDLRIGRARRPGEMRGEAGRAGERQGSLLLQYAGGAAHHPQVRGVHVQVEGDRVQRGGAVRRNLKAERRCGEGAHQRLATLDVRLDVDAHLADPVDARRTDVAPQGQIASDPVRVELRHAASARLDPRAHFARGGGRRHARRIDAVERERHLVARIRSQREVRVEADPAASGVEPRSQRDRVASELRVGLAPHFARKRRGLAAEQDREVSRRHPEIPQVQLSGARRKVVPSLSGEPALAQRDAHLAHLGAARLRRTGEPGVHVQRDRVHSGRGQLGLEGEPRIRAVRRISRVRRVDRGARKAEVSGSARGRPQRDAPVLQVQARDVDDPLERTALRLHLRRRVARLERAAERRGRLAIRIFHRRDVDARPDELHVAEQHLVGPQRNGVHVQADAVGRERGVPIRVAQIDAIRADGQEAANLDVVDRKPPADRVPRLLGDDARQLLRAGPGVQPDERPDDRQQHERNQRGGGQPGPAQHPAPAAAAGRPRPGQVGRRRLGRVGFAHALAILAVVQHGGSVSWTRCQKASPSVM